MAWTIDEMRARLADDIEDGWTVNLGTGMPASLVSALRGRPVLLHSENGILGVGPAPPPGEEDRDIVNAGKQPVTVVPGGVFMDSLTSFSLIRGGYINLSVMGAYQVAANGDLANWRVPTRRFAGVGGAADLCVGAERVWVLMTHTSKDGSSKLVGECGFPLTAKSVVTRVYTDLAVMDVAGGGFALQDLAPGVSLDDVREATAGPVLEGAASGA
ncbi:MAG: 3-oxoacid CoA-transferase subunit B [Streptosporangiales bacterium]